MLKKAIAGMLSFAMVMTLNLPLSVKEISAAEVSEEEIWAEEEALGFEEEIYTTEESIEGNFIVEEEPVFEGFSDGEASFSDGEASFTDAGSENASFEKTLNVTEGEDITGKLNGALLEMKDKVSDAQMGKVIVPPGNYVITGTICMYSNIHLIANGAVIKKVSPEKHLLLRLGNSIESAGGYDGYRNIVIEGGTWDCNYNTVPNKDEDGGFVGFRLGHARNIEIKNVTFLNNLKAHLLELGGVKDVRITGCTFRGYWKPYEKGGQEAIQIDACKDFIMPEYLPFDGAVCENVYIEGNTFENVFAGVGSHSMVFDRPYKNITIVGNTFRNIKKRAVWCLNYVDSVVKNNVMINVGIGVYVSSLHKKNIHFPEGQKITNKGNQYASNVTVSDNRIHLNDTKTIDGSLWKSSGISVLGGKAQAEPTGIPNGEYLIRGVTIRRNKITGPGNGVRMTLTNDCRVMDNKIELTPSNVIENCGITMGSVSKTTVSRNNIQGAKGNAVYLYKGSSGHNSPTKDNFVTGNVITGCADDGIVIGRNSEKTRVEKNTITGTGANGLVGYGNTAVLFKNNAVNGCGKYGIFLSSAKIPEIYGNKVGGSEADGIRLQKATRAVISENTIEKNKGYGVYGENSSIRVYSKNKLKGNGYKDAIYAANTTLPRN